MLPVPVACVSLILPPAPVSAPATHNESDKEFQTKNQKGVQSQDPWFIITGHSRP